MRKNSLSAAQNLLSNSLIKSRKSRAQQSAPAQASKEFISGVKAIPELEVVGDPEMSVVAFKARNPKDIDIFVLNDLLSQRGWHLSALQNPSALHMCFTAQHVHTIPALIKVRPPHI